ncbi:hypothetical protein IFM89_013475 [Coptis chinensis]|uniref:Uncharacterized protein n=1 Tax=Coptis chinensis TaxID=261450 RepID=A0A835I7M7_9MAGN|nr:hypothetical protein IFM89_013475 [Coptis chinensis]
MQYFFDSITRRYREKFGNMDYLENQEIEIKPLFGIGEQALNKEDTIEDLLHFLESEKFKNKEDFVERYKNLSSFNELEVLPVSMANDTPNSFSAIFTEVIKDMEKSLPPKIERILRVEMSPIQKHTMARPLLGKKPFMIHYGGNWETTILGKINSNDYKGGMQKYVKVDGDEFCLIDLKRDVQKLVGEGVGFQIASIIQGYICRITQDKDLMYLWDELKPEKDKKYHIFVFPIPTSQKPTRAPVIPSTAAPVKSPTKIALPVKSSKPMSPAVKSPQKIPPPVKSSKKISPAVKSLKKIPPPVKSPQNIPSPVPTTPKNKSVQISQSVRRSPRFTETPQPSQTSVNPTSTGQKAQILPKVKGPNTPTGKRPKYSQKSPIRRSARFHILVTKPVLGPNGEPLVLEISDDEVAEDVEGSKNMVESQLPPMDQDFCTQNIHEYLDELEHASEGLNDDENVENMVYESDNTELNGELNGGLNGELNDGLNGEFNGGLNVELNAELNAGSDDEGDKYKYDKTFGPVFGSWMDAGYDSAESASDDDEYNPTDSDYSNNDLDNDIDPMVVDEEVHNLEEELQGSVLANVMGLSRNIYEEEEVAKVADPVVEKFGLCELKPKMSWPLH